MKLKKTLIISAITVMVGGALATTYFFSNKVKSEELYSGINTDIKKDIDDSKNNINTAKDDENKKQEEMKKQQEEQMKIEEEKKQAEEQKQAEIKKQQEEEKRAEEIKKQQEEQKKQQEEAKKQQEAQKKQQEEKMKQEDQKNQSENKEQVQQNVQPVSGSNIIQSAKSYAVPVKQVNAMLNGQKNGQKEVFLTFDDGPSSNTPKVLEILKKYGVHGTFFVLGSNVEGSSVNKQYLKDVYNSGNAIGNHTYSHNFKTLYPGNTVSVSAFMNELNKTNGILKGVLGNSFSTGVMRMPGGYMSRQYYKDGNLGALNNALNKAGIVSLDWNVDSADASGVNVASSKILSNTIKEAGNSEDVVVLMHDANGKGTTVQALPQIIEYFKGKGYSFKVISN